MLKVSITHYIAVLRLLYQIALCNDFPILREEYSVIIFIVWKASRAEWGEVGCENQDGKFTFSTYTFCACVCASEYWCVQALQIQSTPLQCDSPCHATRGILKQCTLSLPKWRWLQKTSGRGVPILFLRCRTLIGGVCMWVLMWTCKNDVCCVCCQWLLQCASSGSVWLSQYFLMTQIQCCTILSSFRGKSLARIISAVYPQRKPRVVNVLIIKRIMVWYMWYVWKPYNNYVIIFIIIYQSQYWKSGHDNDFLMYSCASDYFLCILSRVVHKVWRLF